MAVLLGGGGRRGLPGINILLQAAPGVGSTVALRCLATQCGLDLVPIDNCGASLKAHLRTIDAMLNQANRSRKRRLVVVELSDFAVTEGSPGGGGGAARPSDEGFSSFVRLAGKDHAHHLVVVATKQWSKRVGTISRNPAFERVQMNALTLTELRHVALRVLNLAGLMGSGESTRHPRALAILGTKTHLEFADEWAERVALQAQGSARKAAQMACAQVDEMGRGFADCAPPAPARTDTEDGQRALLMHHLANRDKFSVWSVATGRSAEDAARAALRRFRASEPRADAVLEHPPPDAVRMLAQGKPPMLLASVREQACAFLEPETLLDLACENYCGNAAPPGANSADVAATASMSEGLADADVMTGTLWRSAARQSDAVRAAVSRIALLRNSWHTTFRPFKVGGWHREVLVARAGEARFRRREARAALVKWSQGSVPADRAALLVPAVLQATDEKKEFDLTGRFQYLRSARASARESEVADCLGLSEPDQSLRLAPGGKARGKAEGKAAAAKAQTMMAGVRCLQSTVPAAVAEQARPMMTELVEGTLRDLKRAVDRALDSDGEGRLDDLRGVLGSAKDGVRHHGADSCDGGATSAEAAKASGRGGSERVSAVRTGGSSRGEGGAAVPSGSHERGRKRG